MEPQLAKWHQINAEQNQRILQIAVTFLRTATPMTREAEEKRAQSEIEEVLTTEQDQLIRNEIWFAINATRLRAHVVHDQLGLNSAQRRRIDDVWNKFENEVRENNGWLADGTDSYKQVLGDILAVMTVPQRELFFSKLQDPVFDAGYLPVPIIGTGKQKAFLQGMTIPLRRNPATQKAMRRPTSIAPPSMQTTLSSTQLQSPTFVSCEWQSTKSVYF